MNKAATVDEPHASARSKRLKAETNTTHDRLDRTIMAHDPFASRDRYGLFVKVQHAFHCEIDALYDDAVLDRLLPDLGGRRRLPKIRQDLADLGIAEPQCSRGPAFRAGMEPDLPSALGWLYVAEGSNLGAAFLFKDAVKLGLSETFGARHLAGAPEGRGLHWRTFTAALDTVPLSSTEDARAIAAAEAAFRRVHALVEQMFAALPTD